MEIKNAVIIGSGNVAWHLAINLHNAGIIIKQICSRKLPHAAALAQRVAAAPICCPEDIDTGADLYIISISDDAVAHFVQSMPLVRGIVCHTAGSLHINLLSRFLHYAVIYPMQTFSKAKELKIETVPFFIESPEKETADRVKEMALKLSPKVSFLASEKRIKLHISAVFACNFVNHLFTRANDVLTGIGLDFDLLKPLISQTVDKAFHNPPAQGQTGPAMRNDQKTVTKHIDSMKENTDMQIIYKILSDSITAYHQKK